MRHVTGLAKTSCVLAFFFCLVAACTEDKSIGGVTLTSSAAIELYPVANQTGTVSFYASSNWKATCTADWFVFTPSKGSAGENTITLTTISGNRTKATRSGQLMITSGGSQKSVTVVQSGKYALFMQDETTQGPEGGELTLFFVSNLEENDKLQVGYHEMDWIGWADQSRMTRSEWKGSLPKLYLQPNTSTEIRTASYVLMMGTPDGEWLGLDTCYVHQLCNDDDYESTDYSADGTVTLLQRATMGRGINVVMMGDGFADRDIANGTYMQVMLKTLENMFSEEPVRSLRDYFTVYAVTAVSKNSGVRVGGSISRSTVFSTVPSLTDSNISCDEEKIKEYMRKVSGVNPQNTQSIVILNCHSHNGVTYWYTDYSHNPLHYSLALCPVIDSLESETFRQVLTHEAIGHGLGKLGDEYSYESQGRVTDEAASKLNSMHDYGWLTNVDSSSDPSAVAWSWFIGNAWFQNEAIGIYEGGYTYIAGIFRPTEESMMNSNRSPFNAPSRYAIYKKVMELGEGRTDVSYDEFVDFDAQHKPERWDYSTTRSQASWQQWRPAPPRVKCLDM
jgi:hypothetical protein